MATRQNFIYNLMGSILPILVGLITIPFYLKLIGADRFGVLSIVWLILGYFSLFNLGMGKAITVELSILDKTKFTSGQVFLTALLINIFFSVVAILIFYGAYLLFGIPIKTEPDILAELNNTIFWLSLILPLAIIGSIFAGVLQAYERFLLGNTITVITSTLSMVVPITVAYFYSISLTVLIPAIFMIRFIASLITFFICIKLIHSTHWNFSLAIAKRLLSFGGWITLTSVISPVMVIMDRLVISYIHGAKFVTFYTIPYQLTEKINLLAMSVTNTIYPKIAKSDKQQAIAIAVKSLRYLLALNTPFVVIGIFALKPFLAIWIDHEFANNTIVVAKLLLVSLWINGVAFIPDTFLQATSRPNINAKIHTLEVLPYLALLYFSLQYWGIAGAAVASGVRFFVDFILMSKFSGLLESFKKICPLPFMTVCFSLFGSFLSDLRLQLLVLFVSEIILIIYFLDIYKENFHLLRNKLFK